MKILFYEPSADVTIGSHRLYMHNLREQINLLGYEVAFNRKDFENYSIIICGKSVSLKLLKEIRIKTNALIGIANCTEEKIKEFDFCISASQSERIYCLQYQQNIVSYPQIENFFREKKHVDRDVIKLCYHGNKEHLEQMSMALRTVLEKFDDEYELCFRAIYNIKKLGLWKKNRPNINIEDVQWSLNTIEDKISECDIGICPGISPVSKLQKKMFFFLQSLYSTVKVGNSNDYLVRYKCSSNAGRSFVFHQLGLPVVSDVFPEAYHILMKSNCGYIAHNQKSWEYSLLRLCSSANHRQFIANNARNEFDRLYSAKEHATSMIEELVKMVKT